GFRLRPFRLLLVDQTRLQEFFSKTLQTHLRIPGNHASEPAAPRAVKIARRRPRCKLPEYGRALLFIASFSRTSLAEVDRRAWARMNALGGCSMQHALLRWILAVVAVGTSACGVSANPDCGMSSFGRPTPFSQCNHSIEKALEEFAFSERARLEPDVSGVNGTYLGTVTGVGERHIEMVLRDEERTLHWPEPLPFSVSPGEELAAQVDESSATFYFLEGSLALFRDERADPRQDGLRIGPIEAKWKTGCTSSRGKTLKLVVGDTSIAAGRTAEVQSWHIHHFGAVVDPASNEDCPGASAGSQLGAWIAHSTQE